MLAFSILLSLLASIIPAVVVLPALADDLPVTPAPIRVVLTSGDTLEARCVQPAPFDMVGLVPATGDIRYLPPNRIRAILDEAGVDRGTIAVFANNSVHDHGIP